MSDQEQRAKQAVLAVYPKAHCIDHTEKGSNFLNFKIYSSRDWGAEWIGSGMSESYAWDNAASRLAPTREVEEASGKERVLQVWPDAHSWRSYFSETWVINQSTKDGNPEIGHGKTETEAWADAASKLPASPEPKVEQQMCSCGHSLMEHVKEGCLHRASIDEGGFMCPCLVEPEQQAEGQPTEEIPKALVSDEELCNFARAFYFSAPVHEMAQELQQWRKWAAAKGGR